ncbi:MAG TPA: hypothetical protein VLN73_02190 [Alphaproteobacteria bacterium]|nr:hypothetical protein [Alphaproteobacteria bacterium]
MRAIVRQAFALVGGCILGFGADLGPGDPSAARSVTGPIITLSVPEARAEASLRERRAYQRKKAAEAKAAKERAEKARQERLKGERTKELPVGCAYDTQGSMQAGGEVYLCGGMRYQKVKEPGFEGYEVHPVDMDRDAINEAREQRREAAQKRAEEMRKKREANRRDELPPSCFYDANASIGYSGDIYSCGGVLYRPYEEEGKSGFEVVPTEGQAGAEAEGGENPQESSGGRGSSY